MICPVCESNEIEIDNLSKCDECDHLFQTDLKIAVKYDEKYITDYFEHNSLRQMSLLRAGYVIGSCPDVTDKSIVDIGYGSGDFLRVMKKNGWKIFGCDVHQLDLGIERVSLMDALTLRYNVVSFFDSLEHFNNFDLIKKINSRYIVVSVPCTPNDFFNLYVNDRKKWKHYKPGEHLHYFTPKSIQKLFSNYKLINTSNIEDIIRGPGGVDSNYINIQTYVFKRMDLI